MAIPTIIPIGFGAALLFGGGFFIFGQDVHDAVLKDPQPVPAVAAPYDGCDDCSEPAMQIAWSMDHQTEEWSSDGFHASRRGIYVWIGNSDYGLSVGKSSSVSPAGQGFGWVPSQQDRILIIEAYRRWQYRVSLHASDIHP